MIKFLVGGQMERVAKTINWMEVLGRSCLCPTFSERNQLELLGNSGTQYHPNSREFVQSVQPDSNRTTQNYFQPVSDQKDSQKSDKSLILIDHLIELNQRH